LLISAVHVMPVPVSFVTDGNPSNAFDAG
jgi:hypothetical protein